MQLFFVAKFQHTQRSIPTPNSYCLLLDHVDVLWTSVPSASNSSVSFPADITSFTGHLDRLQMCVCLYWVEFVLTSRRFYHLWCLQLVISKVAIFYRHQWAWCSISWLIEWLHVFTNSIMCILYGCVNYVSLDACRMLFMCYLWLPSFRAILFRQCI